MQTRMKNAGSPEAYRAIKQLNQAIHALGVDPRLLLLVHLRVSQINGCGPCIFASITQAAGLGETAERLHHVAAWRETPFYRDDERAALALAEAATRIQDNGTGVTDEIWDAAADHFTEEQLNGLILEIGLTNLYNRINHTIREQAGKTW